MIFSLSKNNLDLLDTNSLLNWWVVEKVFSPEIVFEGVVHFPLAICLFLEADETHGTYVTAGSAFFLH